MKRILVAEDDRDVAAFLTTLLESAGHEVRHALDGERALELFESEGADIVVLDILLPGRNGFQVAQSIRASEYGADVPIVMLSGVYRGASYRDQARKRFGAVDYLEKPLEADRLMTVILKAMEPPSRRIPPAQPMPSLHEATAEVPHPAQAAPAPAPTGWEDATEVGEKTGPTLPIGAAGRSLEDAARSLAAAPAAAPTHVPKAMRAPRPVQAPVPAGLPVVPADTDKLLSSLLAADSTGDGSGPALGAGLGTGWDGAADPPDDTEAQKDDEPQPEMAGAMADPDSIREVRLVERSVRVPRGAAQGDLRITPFPVLLHRLFKDRASGALLLVRDPIKKIVYFRDGFPVYVKSNLLSECLGKVLVRERLITDNQCRDSLRLLQETKRQQGSLLIQMGALSSQNLVYGLQLQLRTKLYEIFSWPGGEYRFSARTRVPVDVTQLEMSTAEIIFEGVRVYFEPERLKQELEPSLDLYVEIAKEGGRRLNEVPLTAADRLVIAAINGQRTVRELLQRASTGPGSAAQLLYALLCSEIVDSRTQPAQDRAASDRSEAPTGALHPIRRPTPRAFGAQHVPEAPIASAPSPEPAHAADTAASAGTLEDVPMPAIEDMDGLLAEGALPPPAGIDDQVDRTLAAEHQFQKGEWYLLQRRYPEAVRALRKANALCPDQSEFMAHLGWAIFLAGGEPAADEALESLDRAIERSPGLDRPYLLRGYVWKAIGRPENALRDFEQAVACNPSSTEANEELRALSPRGKQGR